MNKKIFLIIITIIAIICFIFVIFIINNNKKISEESSNIINTQNSKIDEDKVKESMENSMESVYIKINDKSFNVKLEESIATKELIEKLKNGDIIVNAHEYGGFEKVGNLGFSLTREDKSITTTFGDIVLYQGNQISLFYNSNSWSYTRLGKIKDITQNDLKNILGSGDVTLIFTLSK